MENKITVSELPINIIEALTEKEKECITLLDISAQESPEEVVERIYKYVDKLLSEDFSEEDMNEYALQLGTLWAIMVIKKYGWQWKYIDFGNEVKGIYIVSPQAYYCCPPLYFLNKILQRNNAGPGGENDNTVMLLFNMLKEIENQKPAKNYQIVS